MRALFDVNVLLALFDEDHVFHERAHDWLGKHLPMGWASCPLTENGFLRIRSHPNYHPLKKCTVAELSTAVQGFVEASDHEFWSDSISLRDPGYFDHTRILGPRQITDLYLLALATGHGGCLVTFDEAINLSAVPGARPENLCVI